MPPKTAHAAVRRNYRTKQPAADCADEDGPAPFPPGAEEAAAAAGGQKDGGPQQQQQQQDGVDSPPRDADAAGWRAETASENDDDDAPETGESLEDLFEFRRLRKRKHGIDSEKLQKGESKKKRSRAGAAFEGSASGGAGAAEQAAGAEDEEKESRVIKDNFTKQTNALDVDKHMMAYIESQLQKRRGARTETGEEEEVAGAADPKDELFRTPDYLKVEKQKEREENVTQSTAMLTAIPEVDLGIDARLRNIEKTERAKRQMLEAKARRRASNEFGGSSHVATERFWRGGRRIPGDQDRPPHRGGGGDAGGHGGHGGGAARRRGAEQRATDDLVVERFKKKMRKF